MPFSYNLQPLGKENVPLLMEDFPLHKVQPMLQSMGCTWDRRLAQKSPKPISSPSPRSSSVISSSGSSVTTGINSDR